MIAPPLVRHMDQHNTAALDEQLTDTPQQVPRKIHAATPLMAPYTGKAILTGLTVLHDDLSPLDGHPA